MDFQPEDTTKPISDDQELAEALAGISPNTNTELGGFEETPTAPAINNDTVSAVATDAAENANTELANEATPIEASVKETIEPTETTPASYSKPTDDLEDIKKDALIELRPLVDKLNLDPQEKFDIYLLLLRSTDDETLIAPAHAAAQNITDESKRAQALLDVIREIDYLSSPKPAE